MSMTFKSSVAMQVRAAQESDIDDLAQIWHDGWQDAHAQILPAALAQHRTLECFRQTLQAALLSVRVASSLGSLVGFCIIHGDELYQLYVSANGRGTGVGGDLLADAELQFLSKGVNTAWLACAIGNERAATFYQKHGWQYIRTMLHQLDTPSGPFLLEVWRFEKDLRSTPLATPAWNPSP